MTNYKKTVFLTAAAVILCLCGIFMPQGTAPAEDNSNPTAEFSSEDAEKYLTLSATIYSPDTFDDYMRKAGFENYTFAEREQTPQYGSGVAFALACKESTLYAIIRGSVGCEWYSNFDIGEGESHTGFLSAADYVCERIRMYREENFGTEDNLSLVLTGHSRGGAVANLAAKNFIDSADFEGVTAYTFASPNTTTRKDASLEKYSTIFNIENPEDFICSIPPEGWGYTKYGEILKFPAVTYEGYEELYPEMQEKFLAITGYEHRGFQHGSADTEGFIKELEVLSPTVRDYYTKRLHSPVGDITLYEYMNKTATMLCGENTIRDGMFILTSSFEGDFAPLASFMLSGLGGGAPSQSDIMKSAVGCAHTPETYMAWLSVAEESGYFPFSESNTEILNE